MSVCLFVCLSVTLSGCISLGKSKIGLLRDITRILFYERNKKIQKKRERNEKSKKRIFPSRQLIACSIVKNAYDMDFFESFPKETQKS